MFTTIFLWVQAIFSVTYKKSKIQMQPKSSSLTHPYLLLSLTALLWAVMPLLANLVQVMFHHSYLLGYDG